MAAFDAAGIGLLASSSTSDMGMAVLPERSDL
jgi:hypothetical protein